MGGGLGGEKGGLDPALEALELRTTKKN